MSYEWLKLERKLDGLQPPERVTFFSVNGTGSPDPFGFGFSGDIGRALNDEIFFWQPVAYPAAVFPMGPSVGAGVAELVRLIKLYSGPIALSGYSQGSIVVDKVWRDHIWNPNGDLHSRLPDVIGIVNFGDPMRCPGICNGNALIGQAVPGQVDGFTTGGIAGPDDLTPEQTPDLLLSCNNDGDLYGACPVGDNPWNSESAVGHDETMVFNLIQNFNANNVLALATEALSLLNIGSALNLGTIIQLAEAGIGGVVGNLGGIIPSTGASTPGHVVAIVEALLNGGMFVASGFGPHGDYGKFVGPAVNWLTQRALA